MHPGSSRIAVPASVLPVVAAIALSCTDIAGAWCSQTFAVAFRTLFGTVGSAPFWMLRFVAEKSVHVTLFTTLGLVLSLACRRSSRRLPLAIATGFALGCCSELFQRLFPTRDPAIRDVLINWTGVLAGVTISFYLEKVFTRNKRPVFAAIEEIAFPTTAHSLLVLSAQTGLSEGALVTERRDASQLAGIL